MATFKKALAALKKFRTALTWNHKESIASIPQFQAMACALAPAKAFPVVPPSAFRRNPWFGKLLGYGRPQGGRHA
jgi:hypothetical protein